MSSPGTQRHRAYRGSPPSFRVFCLPSGCCSEKNQAPCSFLLSLPAPNICLADLTLSKLVLGTFFSSADSLPSCPATGEKLGDEICRVQCVQVPKTANFSSEITLGQMVSRSDSKSPYSLGRYFQRKSYFDYISS